MTSLLPKVFALLGPTASGKTSLALALAEKYPIEIISLDSALVYQDMDIGTAKPNAKELATVPHHLISIISPLQSYNAAQFVSDCLRLIKEIHARSHLPVIVGGTMMYYHALTQGLNNLPEADTAIRNKLNQLKQQNGSDYLYSLLQQLDPASAQRLPAGDSQRIERALEIYYITGKPMSSQLDNRQTLQPQLDIFSLALLPENRAQLHQQIAKRFQTMLSSGFIEEVVALKQKYPTLHPDLPSIRCVGYRQAWDYLAGTIDQSQFIERSIVATRQLAKRQLTWLRKLQPHLSIDPFTSPNLLDQADAAFKTFFA